MTIIPIQINRSCDGCTECCQGWLTATIHGRPMYSGRPCHFVSDNGCSIYKDRPKDPCVDYKCNWLQDTNIPEWLKPSKAKVIISNRRWGPNSEFQYWEIRECGVKIDSVVLNWIYSYCSSHNIQMRVQVDGGWHTMGPPEFQREMND